MSSESSVLKRVLSLADFERLARKRLPGPLFAYVSGACEDNQSLVANRSAFGDYELSTRILIDVSKRSQGFSLFGHAYASPFGIAPMGIAALTAYRGDVVLAEAALRANIPAIMSGWSLIPMEQVVKVAPRTWFQAYLSSKQERMDAMIGRVAKAGFETLVITVDTPVESPPAVATRFVDRLLRSARSRSLSADVLVVSTVKPTFSAATGKNPSVSYARKELTPVLRLQRSPESNGCSGAP